ncbi:MAG: hypothetical protein FD180_2150 [Planctomycetota bacterium]|nr:MAG: hypothetical protein FD180_2150 [Planctomycetota bacterium]
MKSFALAVAFTFAAALFAHADKVFMKDGKVWEGKVVDEKEDVIKLKVKSGTIPLKRADIDHIEKGTSALEELDVLLETLVPSNPAGYVDAARLCVDRGAGDGPTVERLANIAISLDPALCGRAQEAIGDWYFAKGNRARAAEAYLAAFTADWKSPSIKDKFLKHRDGIAEQQKTQTRRLSDSVQLAIDGRLSEAIAGLQASTNAPGASLISTYVRGYANFQAFVSDVRSRVPCKNCEGKLWTKCISCSGEGGFKCSTCGGTGVKITTVNGTVTKRVECSSCDGKGTIRCTRCKERMGQSRCSTCKGVAPKRAGVWDARGLASFKAAIDQRLDGSVPAEEQVGPKLMKLGSTTYDEAFTEDGKIVFSSGKWVKPEEKK